MENEKSQADQLREALRGQGMTMASYRTDIKRQLLAHEGAA